MANVAGVVASVAGVAGVASVAGACCYRSARRHSPRYAPALPLFHVCHLAFCNSICPSSVLARYMTNSCESATPSATEAMV